jgi:hypothetical protein
VNPVQLTYSPHTILDSPQVGVYKAGTDPGYNFSKRGLWSVLGEKKRERWTDRQVQISGGEAPTPGSTSVKESRKTQFVLPACIFSLLFIYFKNNTESDGSEIIVMRNLPEAILEEVRSCIFLI